METLSFFSTFSLYEILYFLGYNLCGIIGIVFTVIGTVSLIKGKQINTSTSAEKKQKAASSRKAKKVIKFKSIRLMTCVTLLLCVALYISFLFAFTENMQRESYICYVNPTGKSYHTINCKYTDKNAKETTVYEACKEDYGKCSACNPFFENNKTKIQIKERDYWTPLLLSVNISVAFFLLATVHLETFEEGEKT